MAMGNDPTNQIDPDGGLSGGQSGGGAGDPPAGWGQGYMIDEVVVTSEKSSWAFTWTLPTFSIPKVPSISVPTWVGTAASKANLFLTLATTMTGDSDPRAIAWRRGRELDRPVTVPITDVKVRDKDKDDGFIRVRHYTSKGNLAKIIAMNAITTGGKGTPWGVDVEVPPFGLVSTAQQNMMTQGSAYVEFSIHPWRIIPIPGTGTATHGNRNTGRIPLGQTGREAMAHPLMLHDKKPIFVGAEWWRVW